MDVLNKLRNIMDEKSISEYSLAKLSNVPQSTINSMFKKYNNPSIYTLEKLCKALDISMSDFFYEETEKTKIISDYKNEYILREWKKLSQKQKEAVLHIISAMVN